MAQCAVNLKIDAPTGLNLTGRGFYQLEEDALYVQIGPFGPKRHFFSVLESDDVRFEMDIKGRLMFIEVTAPRRRWRVDPKMTPPRIAEAADVRWLDFRTQLPSPDLITNVRRTALMLRFAQSSSWCWYRLGGAISIQVQPDDRLAALYIDNLVDDLAGSMLAAFRSESREGAEKPTPNGDSRISLNS